MEAWQAPRAIVKRTQVGDPRIAVAYIRVSKDEQRLGPEAQRAAIRSWGARAGNRIAAWHTDQGVCSVTPIDKRPALSAALDSVCRHGAGVLVVAKRLHARRERARLIPPSSGAGPRRPPSDCRARGAAV